MEVINGSTERRSDKDINRTQTPLAVSCTRGQPRPWGMRGPSTITREVAEPSLCNVPKKSRRVPRTVLTWTTLENLTYSWQTAGWGAAVSPRHDSMHRMRGKALFGHPFHPKFHQQRDQTWIYVTAPLLPRLLRTPSKGWQLRALIATRAANLPMVQNHLFSWNRQSWDFLSPGRAKVFSFTLVTTLSLLRRESYLHSPQEWKCKQ